MERFRRNGRVPHEVRREQLERRGHRPESGQSLRHLAGARQRRGLRYGNRIYDIADLLHTGSNEIEVRVVTVLGNYMHTLTDNATAQKFTAGRKEWPTLSLGILGPVTLYK